MILRNLNDMFRGWIIGNFEPSLLKTNDVEVAVKQYIAGEHEVSHYHKIATEITVIVSGEVEMNGIRYKKNDIIIMEPCDRTDFLAVTDAVNIVVKIPGANNDKYVED